MKKIKINFRKINVINYMYIHFNNNNNNQVIRIEKIIISSNIYTIIYIRRRQVHCIIVTI